MHRYLLTNYWTTSCQLERTCLASFQGLLHFFVFRFVFNIIVLNDFTDLKLNANQFQSHIPRVGSGKLLSFGGEWHVAECALAMFLLCGMRVDSVRLADNFANVIYTVGR